MLRRLLLTCWVLACAVLTIGCGSSTGDESAKEPTLSPTSGPAAAAVADLAARSEIDETEIEVVAEEAVTWSDGNLGCAKEGFSYTQALVEGSRITLLADGTDHEYHSGGSKPPFWCEQPTE